MIRNLIAFQRTRLMLNRNSFPFNHGSEVSDDIEDIIN